MDAQRLKRWGVPAVPFAISLCLSLLTVGTHPYWQDSGLYLTAVKELGVLYPPGFVLYEVLCHIWTRLFFFLDFTLAVHLFSSLCAALAAGAVAVASRDLLRCRGPIFRVTDEDPGELADACGMLAGVFLACGFTFWSAAIYAKGYSFYFLILALLLWRMIRADESGRRRDFVLVAVLIGLAWQAHPSATLTGLALLAFVAVHGRKLGWKGVAQGAGAAAACALGPSVVLLPWLAGRDAWLKMGHPDGIVDAVKYVVGRRFLTVPGVFGFDPVREASFGLFLWEELLGIGLLLVTLGIVALVRGRRPLLWGILAWTLPYALVTILFKIEGQHDCWFVGAWMPLYLALGVGAAQVARWAAVQARPVLLAIGVAGIAWAALANLPDVNQRDYLLAELYGRTLIQNVDPDALLLLHGDDANGLAAYLQRVRGERPDVLLISANFLAHDSGGHWYDEILLRRHAFLQPPKYASFIAQFPQHKKRDVATAAFLNTNAKCGRPLFCEQYVPLEMIRPDYTLIPAGSVWKLVPQGPSVELNLNYWKFPIEPEKIPPGSRRARGQKVQSKGDEFNVAPQRYEERLVQLIVMARFHLAMALTEREKFVPAAKLCESIFALGGDYGDSPEIIHIAAISLYASGDDVKAEPLLRKSAEVSTLARNRATASCYLGEIARKKGDEAEAQRCFARALGTPGLDKKTRNLIESRMRPK